jgi:3-hydroxyacyl-[acyl-carrier-protein] dehydratase
MREVAPGWKDKFIGFGGVDGIRFRGSISPPARMWITAREGSYRSNMARMPVQGQVGDRIVFGGEVLGVLI